MQSRQEIRPSLRNACKVTLLPVSAALLVMTVTALLFAAAGRGGGGSVGASPTIGKLAYPGGCNIAAFHKGGFPGVRGHLSAAVAPGEKSTGIPRGVL